MRALWLIVPACAALAGCQLSRMAGFSGLAAEGDEVALVGVGGWMRGSFRLSDGSAAGRFSRGADQRFRAVGLDTSDDQDYGAAEVDARARLAFTLDGARVGGTLDGACRARREDDRVRAGAVTFVGTRRPLLVDCRFDRNGAPYADMRLDAVQVSGPEIVEPVAGTLRFRGRELAIESAHEVEGTRIETEDPIGYRFRRADGSLAGAAERNGGTRIALVGDAEERLAVLAAGTALGLMWMPEKAE